VFVFVCVCPCVCFSVCCVVWCVCLSPCVVYLYMFVCKCICLCVCLCMCLCVCLCMCLCVVCLCVFVCVRAYRSELWLLQSIYVACLFWGWINSTMCNHIDVHMYMLHSTPYHQCWSSNEYHNTFSWLVAQMPTIFCMYVCIHKEKIFCISIYKEEWAVPKSGVGAGIGLKPGVLNSLFKPQ